jgi:hypothetical protein
MGGNIIGVYALFVLNYALAGYDVLTLVLGRHTRGGIAPPPGHFGWVTGFYAKMGCVCPGLIWGKILWDRSGGAMVSVPRDGRHKKAATGRRMSDDGEGANPVEILFLSPF